MILGTELSVYVYSFQVSKNSTPNIWSPEVSFSRRPCSTLIISMLHSYLSHNSSKVICVCILSLLASALAPIHCKMFVALFVTLGHSGQAQRTVHRTFEVNVEHCSLNCSSCQGCSIIKC